MRPEESRAFDRPVVFALHYLGGSALAWQPVANRLTHARLVAIDLLGFGDAARAPAYTVDDMALAVAEAIRVHAPPRWLLAGHSMGAKVACAIARRIEDDALERPGFEGLILIAGSPPGPEPIPDDKRQEMLSWFAGDDASSRAQAERYVAQNTSEALPRSLAAVAVADVLRADRAAWTAWLTSGSREDWSQRIGILQTPALVVAGAEDESLGPEAQRTLVAPHLTHLRTLELAGATHLLPLERPDEIARAIDAFADDCRRAGEPAARRRAAYGDLIASERVSATTRAALLARSAPIDARAGGAGLPPEALAALRAVVRRVVPQSGAVRLDLAARIAAELADGAGDGWRFADLPPDREACLAALATLDAEARRRVGHEFASASEAERDAMLETVAAGALEPPPDAAGSPDALNAAQMQHWFEDLRAAAVRAYLGHPATLARIGYGGIAYGGDGEPKSGFARIGIGEREAWEPVAATGGDR